LYEIENVLRDYAWGSTTAIAALLGRAESGRPEAELWIGAHPDSPSVARVPEDGSATALDALISRDPEHFLGAESVARFGPRLPFLAKILAAAQPLSLQVHPSLDQARAGFARENAEGLAAHAPNRNYRDDNHKPEMIFALTPFEALCGFRPAAQTREILQHVAAAFDAVEGAAPALIRCPAGGSRGGRRKRRPPGGLRAADHGRPVSGRRHCPGGCRAAVRSPAGTSRD
jgi:mannose-6-phosphate isomerase